MTDHVAAVRAFATPRLKNLRALAGAAFKHGMDAQIDVQAAQVAFNAAFSIGPLLALALTLLSAVPYHAMREAFGRAVLPYVPLAARPLIEGQLHEIARSPNPLLVVLSVVGLLWTISSATGAISVALGGVGWHLPAGFVARRLRAVAIGIIGALGLALSAVAAVVGPFLLTLVSRLTRLPLASMASIMWVRWPAAGVAFGLTCALFVAFGTADRPHFRAIVAGAASSGVISVLASVALSFYLSRAPSLGGAYGAAGAVFATLLWLYLLALGLLAGATVAYVIEWPQVATDDLDVFRRVAQRRVRIRRALRARRRRHHMSR